MAQSALFLRGEVTKKNKNKNKNTNKNKNKTVPSQVRHGTW